MKAKKIISGIIVIGMTFGITGLSFAEEKFDHLNHNKQFVKTDRHNVKAVVKADKRQDRQADMIYQGIKTGKITSSEYKNLMREQERIDQAEKRALRDGRITRMEQEKLNWMQKKARENIYEAKNNRRVARDVDYHSWNKHYRK
ncbi:Uncharacterized protein dnl_31860 [Desulfonema limicola]|uniref:Uncharacterized protein n=1 Tax=Desulfonema limicola TaxID=45656 RepID=A0A975B8V8_9BACT|nr:hypothetical protein [Desulfonema limicola]QTA80873.1 Uncharacterized protein dnl_31860 [Desulfonema limicola]